MIVKNVIIANMILYKKSYNKNPLNNIFIVCTANTEIAIGPPTRICSFLPSSSIGLFINTNAININNVSK